MNQPRPILYGIWCTPTPANPNQLPGSFIPAGPWSYEEALFRAESNNQSNRYFHYEPRPAFDPEPQPKPTELPRKMSPPTVPFDPDAGPEEEPDFPQPDPILQSKIDNFCEHWTTQFAGHAATGEMLGKLTWRASHELGCPVVITIARTLRGMDSLVGFPLPPTARGATGPMGPPAPPPEQRNPYEHVRRADHFNPFGFNEQTGLPRLHNEVCTSCNGTGQDTQGFGLACHTCQGHGCINRTSALTLDGQAGVARWENLRLACEHGTPGCRGRGDKHACNPSGSNG